MFPSFAALAVLGIQAAAQRSPIIRLSSPTWSLGSQPAAAPAGDRDVAAEITNYEQRRVLSGYVMTDSNIRTAGAAWFSDASAAETTYGHISTWETSGVTDMSWLFCARQDWMDEDDDEPCPECDSCVLPASANTFNEDIGAWDTSGVKTMYGMFNGASSFNQDIGDWAVDSVTHMGGLFNGALAFNQDVGAWDTSSVKNMADMFQETSSFNEDIGAWNTAGVTDMIGMFAAAIAFDQDISGWTVDSVTDMSYMFHSATSFDQDLGWCVDDDVEFADGDGSLTFQDAFAGTKCASTS